MLCYLTRLACISLIFALPIKAMQQPQEQQPQVQEAKSLKVQALLKVIKSPEISNEQIQQLPQDLQKVALLIRSTRGDVTKAFFKALKVREDLLEVICRLARLQRNNIKAAIDTQGLLEQVYSVEDIRMLIKCGANINGFSRKVRHTLTYAFNVQDTELLKMLLEENVSLTLPDGSSALFVWLIRISDELQFGCHKPNLEDLRLLLKANADKSLLPLFIDTLVKIKSSLEQAHVDGLDKYINQILECIKEYREESNNSDNLQNV